LTSPRGPNSLVYVARFVLMVEVSGEDATDAADRLERALRDVRVWGAVEPTQAALLVLDAELPAV
jgi:hypothetical protein